MTKAKTSVLRLEDYLFFAPVFCLCFQDLQQILSKNYDCCIFADESRKKILKFSFIFRFLTSLYHYIFNVKAVKQSYVCLTSCFAFFFCKEVFEVQPGKFAQFYLIGKLRLHYENVKALYFVKVLKCRFLTWFFHLLKL